MPIYRAQPFSPAEAPASLLLPVVPYDSAAGNPLTGAGCPAHTAGSAADINATTVARCLGQDSKYNTFDLEYDFRRHYGASVGYRFGRRTIGSDLISSIAETFYPSNPRRGDGAVPRGTVGANGVCTYSVQIANNTNSLQVNEDSGLFGFWAHPRDQLRANLDVELLSADNSPTRISPRNLQHYKTPINYRPRRGARFSGTVNMLESRNNVTGVMHREHNRNLRLHRRIESQAQLRLRSRVQLRRHLLHD